MSSCFNLPGGLIVAEVTLEPQSISGAGGVSSPALCMQFRMHLRGPVEPARGIDFRTFACRVSPFDGEYFATSQCAPVDILASTRVELPNRLLHVAIPLDQLRLSRIEQHRKGGDVNLRLDCELVADEMEEVGNLKNVANRAVWGLKAHHRLHSQFHVVIPRSVWVEQVLPQTGFGQIHILELPKISIERCEGRKEAFRALQQAQKLEREGLYDETVGACRKALEPFFEHVDKIDEKGATKKVPVLTASWETRLGKATYDWLNASLLTLKGPTNRAVHNTSTTFGQLEAQMLLLVATAVISYAVKVQPPPS